MNLLPFRQAGLHRDLDQLGLGLFLFFHHKATEGDHINCCINLNSVRLFLVLCGVLLNSLTKFLVIGLHCNCVVCIWSCKGNIIFSKHFTKIVCIELIDD